MSVKASGARQNANANWHFDLSLHIQTSPSKFETYLPLADIQSSQTSPQVDSSSVLKDECHFVFTIHGLPAHQPIKRSLALLTQSVTGLWHEAPPPKQGENGLAKSTDMLHCFTKMRPHKRQPIQILNKKTLHSDFKLDLK